MRDMPQNYREVALFMLGHGGPKVAIAAISFCMLARWQLGWHWMDVAVVAAMFFLRGFLEWVFHRYVWHSHPLPFVGWRIRGPIATMHANHHKNPYASDGLIFGAPGVLLVCSLIVGAGQFVVGFSLSVSMLLGFLLVLVTHEWHHVIAHSGINPVSPLFRRAVECHRQHHHGSSNACMGVSSALADRLLGTLSGKDERPA